MAFRHTSPVPRFATMSQTCHNFFVKPFDEATKEVIMLACHLSCALPKYLLRYMIEKLKGYYLNY